MNAKLKLGKYVLAVSGGVDSMVLLHLLSTNLDFRFQIPDSSSQLPTPTPHLPTPNFQFVVAHYDHGIRKDSARDRKLVEKTAKKLGWQFVYAEGKLGADTSEAQARDARYKFLRKTAKDSRAQAIITAHHQDDALETLFINMLRGTGRRGVLKETSEIKRPLLGTTKAQIIEYAKANDIEWYEDSTNADMKYLRNYIRGVLIPKMEQQDPESAARFLASNSRLGNINKEIEKELSAVIEGKVAVDESLIKIPRQWLIMLPNEVGKEVLYECARRLKKDVSLDRKSVELLLVFSKTAKSGKTMELSRDIHVRAQSAKIFLELV